MINFKVGILGAGRISSVIAETLNKLDSFEPYAIAARDKSRADDFAAKHHIAKSYGSYEELVQDPEVELVYIGTVNSTHAPLAEMCIRAGKPCLVEKPFSYNAVTAKKVLDLAAEKNVFCGEAMWLRYVPMMSMLTDIIHNKKLIGPLKFITANLGYDLRDSQRVLSPETAGGALLDIGIYPITAVFMLMGQAPASMASAYSRLKTGVDAIDSVQMNFNNGAQASIYTTMMTDTDNRIMIYGEGGRIEVDNCNNPQEIRIYTGKNELAKTINPPDNQINGYEYEFLAAREAVIVGKLDTPQHPRISILQVMAFMDMLRKAWQVFYPLPGEPSPEEIARMEAERKAAMQAGKKKPEK